MRELADLRRVSEPQIHAFEAPVSFDEDLRRAIHQHISDFAIVQERLQKTKPEELRAKRLELLLRHITRYGGTHPLTQREPSGGIRVQREHRVRIKTRGDVGAHTRQN
jgi:hypothetical protein